jgi:DNA-binding transcriptional LysR family regulator
LGRPALLPRGGAGRHAGRCGTPAGRRPRGRRLGSLEKALGTPLFTRAPDGLHLTPAGERLLPHAQRMADALAQAREELVGGPARVRLAMPTGFTRLFTTHLPRLRADHPELELELLTGAHRLDLKHGEAELAIRSGPVTDADLVARALGHSGWSLYASPAYLARHQVPQDLDDLGGHELIGYDPALAGVPAAQWMEQRLPGARLALRSREMTDMPCLIGDDEPALRRLTPAVLAQRELWLVYPREARLAEPVQAVIRFVLEVMRANAPRIAGSEN